VSATVRRARGDQRTLEHGPERIAYLSVLALQVIDGVGRPSFATQAAAEQDNGDKDQVKEDAYTTPCVYAVNLSSQWPAATMWVDAPRTKEPVSTSQGPRRTSDLSGRSRNDEACGLPGCDHSWRVVVVTGTGAAVVPGRIDTGVSEHAGG
jgi:hypothetical protein